jgi:hypothetical protein
VFMRYPGLHQLQGISCLVTGLLCNKFVLEAIFSTDGNISSLSVNIALIVLQISLICAGLLFLTRQYRYLAMIGISLLLLFFLQFWVRLCLEIPFPEKWMFETLPKPPSLFEAGLNYQDQISRYEARFADLKAMLPASGTVGYITSEHLPPEHAKFHWGLTTYVLAPFRVIKSTESEVIIGNFPDFELTDSRDTIAHLTLVKDFGNGVLLLNRKDAP